MADAAYRIVVHGRVQGVGFRDWTRRTASSRGLSGWCRNLRDGTVEILVSGPDGQIDGFREDLKSGPPAAKVEDIEVSESDERFSGEFELRATA